MKNSSASFRLLLNPCQFIPVFYDVNIFSPVFTLLLPLLFKKVGVVDKLLIEMRHYGIDKTKKHTP
jgi:hypothetical protein